MYCFINYGIKLFGSWFIVREFMLLFNIIELMDRKYSFIEREGSSGWVVKLRICKSIMG